MSRGDCLVRDLAGVQAFLDEFSPCGNGERRIAELNGTAELAFVRNFPLPDQYRPDHVDILLLVADYPARPPIGLYILNDNNAALLSRLKRVFNLYADAAFHEAPAITGYTWICYHYVGNTWRYNARSPHAGDNLRKFLACFFAECEKVRRAR